jgi:PAS domain S-box-containing protein
MLVMESFDPGFAAHPRHPGLEALEASFCMLDARWRVTYWNAAAERVLGVPHEHILGRVLWDALPFLRRSPAWQQLHRVQSERVVVRFLESYGGFARGFATVRAAPLPDGGMTVEFGDATEEVRRADQYAALLESIRDGFVAVDEGWRIVYLNSVAESLLRFPRDRAVGVSIWPLLPEEPAEIAQCLQMTMGDGMQRHLRAVRPEGRVFRARLFDLWTHPLAGGGISIFFEDVSDRARREKELARLAEEAEEANQAKGRFFAAVSHELRTPLNAIVGYTHLLNTGTYGAMPHPAQRAAERVGVCAEHLSRLVDDVLLLTTAEIGRLPVSSCPILLQEYLPSIVAPLEIQAQAKGLGFDLSVTHDLPQLQTDPQRLRQLLLALLSNAVKFTDRGQVGVRAALRDGALDPELHGAGYSLFPEPEVEIVVTDTGPGVAPEHQERIFGPFEQLGDPARSASMVRGTGLGLTIARQLAHLLGGKLYLAETSDSGSRFCVRLPVAFSPPAA